MFSFPKNENRLLHILQNTFSAILIFAVCFLTLYLTFKLKGKTRNRKKQDEKSSTEKKLEVIFWSEDTIKIWQFVELCWSKFDNPFSFHFIDIWNWSKIWDGGPTSARLHDFYSWKLWKLTNQKWNLFLYHFLNS